MQSTLPSPKRRRCARLALALALALALGLAGGGLGPQGSAAFGDMTDSGTAILHAQEAPAGEGGTNEDAEGAGGGTELGMDVRPLFDGWYDPGRWVPLSVDLGNRGPDQQIELQAATADLSNSSTYSVPVELPRGARKRVPLLIQANNSPGARVAAMADRTELAAQEFNLEMTNGEPLIVVIGDESAVPPDVDELGRSQRPIVVHAGADGLPEHALGWGSVDYVVLTGGALGRANEAQRQALAQWVALGGELIVTGGPGASAALDALPEALRPARVKGIREAEGFGALEALAQGKPITGSALIAVLDPAPGGVPIAPQADGSPLLVQRRFGDGVVVALAFDPALPPFPDWVGIEELWRALHVQRGETVWSAPVANLSQLGSGLYQLPEFDLPSLRWLLVLIGLYILLVGPINYLVLRRRRRLDLAWVTIPALTLIFSAATYGASYVIHGRDLVLYELSAVRVIPDAGIAYVQSYVGLFSPSARSYDVALPGALARPVDPYHHAIDTVQGQASGVRDLAVEQWALSSFAAEAVVQWPGADPGYLVRDDSTARGRLANPFGREVHEAAVFTRGGAAPIGRWPAAGTHDANLSTENEGSVGLVFDPATGNTSLRHLEAGILSAAFGYAGTPQGPYGTPGMPGSFNGQPWVTVRDSQLHDAAAVYGWAGEAPLQAEVAGRSPVRREHTLVYAHVPVVQSDREAPPGNILYATVTERSTPSRELCGQGGALFENQSPGQTAIGDELEFRFDLGLGTTPGTPLWVELNGPKSDGAPGYQTVQEVKVRLRTCDSEDWIEVGGGASFGADAQIPLPPLIQAAALARKAVCLRLDPEYDPQNYYQAGPQSCWYPWLVLDAAPGSAPASETPSGGGG